MWRHGWDLLVAWARLMLAIQLLLIPTMLLVGPGDWWLLSPLVFAPAAILATPLIFFWRTIVSRKPPYLGPRYWIVIVYGLLIAAPVWFLGDQHSEGFGGTSNATFYIFLVTLYQVTALVVVLAFVVLWKVGDKFLAPGPRQPRKVARGAVAVLLVLDGGLYAYGGNRGLYLDSCLDAGGVIRNGVCIGARTSAGR